MISLAPLLAVMYFLNPFPLDALGTQSVAMVRGTVIDQADGKPIPGALVFAISRESGLRKAVSNRQGNFYFVSLPPGNYSFLLDERSRQSACWVLEKQSDIRAGFEYVVKIYTQPGCPNRS